jgi:hypothetical protein
MCFVLPTKSSLPKSASQSGTQPRGGALQSAGLKISRLAIRAALTARKNTGEMSSPHTRSAAGPRVAQPHTKVPHFVFEIANSP